MAAGLSSRRLMVNFARGWARGAARKSLATIIPRVSQVDNTSEFLENTPHRQHPGITSLKTVRLPTQLAEAAQLLVEKHPINRLAERAQELTTYLWSRKRPVEDEALRRKAAELEQKLQEKMAPLTAALESQDPQETEKQQEKLRKQVLAELRKTTYHWQPLSYNEELSLVYMVARMDGGYAAVSRAFHEIKKRVPEFQPHTLLDFGSGTGSVTWAAHQAYGETLREYMCIDSSSAMNKLADILLRGGSDSSPSHINGVYFRQFLPVSPKVKYDIVISAFSLSELSSSADRIKTVQTLWRKTDSYLVLLESGTKEGHQILMEARDIILRGAEEISHDPRSGHVFAPCSHDLPCPKLALKAIVPCNFTQAYHPLPFSSNQELKLEKFSYVILQRGKSEGSEGSWPRIVQPVQRRPRHVHCHLCCSDGTLQHAVITAKKHTRDLYRCARNSNWGDRLPVINLETKEKPGVDSESTEDVPSV